LIQTRIQLIAESRTCPTDLKEAISTVLYAAPRVEIPEFMVIRDEFAKKFGREFVMSAMENRDFAVNQRVMIKLSVKVPEPILCVHYLKDIAEEHGIKLDEDQYQDEGPLGTNFQQPPPPSSNGGGMGVIYEPPLQPSFSMNNQPISSQQFHQPSLIQPHQPTTMQYPPPADFNHPPPSITDLTHGGYNVDFTPGHRIVPHTETMPHLDNQHGNYDMSGTMGVEEPPAYDFDDLQKRFEALKRRE
jgi:vacuolar protein sorting-associated protein IST1